MFLSANSTRVREQPWLLLSVFSAQYRWPIMALSTLFPCLYHLLVQESQEQPVLIIFVLLASSRVPGILQARKNQKQKFNCMISKIMRLSWKKNWHQLLSPPHLHAFLFTLSEYFFFFFFFGMWRTTQWLCSSTQKWHLSLLFTFHWQSKSLRSGRRTQNIQWTAQCYPFS